MSWPQTSQVRKWLDEPQSNGQSTTTQKKQPINAGGRLQLWRTKEARQNADSKTRTSTDLHRRLQKGQQSATGTRYWPTRWLRKISVHIERGHSMAIDHPTTHRRHTMTTHGRMSQTSICIQTRTWVAKNFQTSSCTTELKSRKQVIIQVFSPALHLDKRHKLLFAPLHSKNHKTTYYWTPEQFRVPCPGANLGKLKPQTSSHYWKNSPPQISRFKKRTELSHKKETNCIKVFHSRPKFWRNFHFLPTMGIVLVEMPLSEKYAVTLDAKNHLVYSPDISMQIRKILIPSIE